MSLIIFLSFFIEAMFSIKAINDIKIHIKVVKSGKPNLRVIDEKCP